MLGHQPHHAGKSLHGVLVGGFAVKGEAAVEGFEQARDTAQQGRFAAPVGTDNRGNLALRELEGEVFDDGLLAVSEANVLHSEGAFGDFLHRVLSAISAVYTLRLA